MMAPVATGSRTTGAALFDPDILFSEWAKGHQFLGQDDNNLRDAVIETFSIPQSDDYVYHAIASVTLSQVQEAIDHGGEVGLHAWYRDADGKPLPPPPSTDTNSYTAIFYPRNNASNYLKTFALNAKKGSIRASVAEHLLTHRLLPSDVAFPKSKQHVNPYLDFWRWSCENLEWCGPEPNTANVRTSHHILPVFMHHFGCVVPSYEALMVLRHVARGRQLVDLGSGNGYWTYMLRRLGVVVQAVDNLQSSWRTIWIGDTIVKDGDKYLKDEKGAKEKVLLLVYPIVGAEFTKTIINAYKGNTIVVVGTQNSNGYTSFKDKVIDEWMKEEQKGWEKTVQIPLPSFAGKDEAMFVFEKNDG